MKSNRNPLASIARRKAKNKITMEQAWVKLKRDISNRDYLSRYISTLRRADRLKSCQTITI